MSKKQTTKKRGKATTKAKKTAPASDPDRVPLTEAMAKPPGKGRKAKAGEKARRAGGLDAAAEILKAAREPMRCQAIVDAALAKGLWTTGGKTPAATISAAIGREIKMKGSGARFRKTAPGLFAFNG